MYVIKYFLLDFLYLFSYSFQSDDGYHVVLVMIYVNMFYYVFSGYSDDADKWVCNILGPNETTGTKWQHLFIGSTFVQIKSHVDFMIVKVATFGGIIHRVRAVEYKPQT